MVPRLRCWGFCCVLSHWLNATLRFWPSYITLLLTTGFRTRMWVKILGILGICSIIYHLWLSLTHDTSILIHHLLIFFYFSPISFTSSFTIHFHGLCLFSFSSLLYSLDLSDNHCINKQIIQAYAFLASWNGTSLDISRATPRRI